MNSHTDTKENAMLPITKLFGWLGPVNLRYGALKNNFEAFYKEIREQLCRQNFAVQGASMSTLAKNQFNIEFVGRTLRFRFSTLAEQGSTLHGLIECHLMNDDEHEAPLLLDTITFDHHGESDITPKGAEDKLNITNDLAAIQIALHYLQESLSHSSHRLPSVIRSRLPTSKD
jgi:hypothetical protein